MKYHRYVPRYRRELVGRAGTCNIAFIWAYLEAWRNRPSPIKGFGGWHVKQVLKNELANFFEAE